MTNLVEYPNMLNWALIIRAEAEGTVFGKELVRYTPSATGIARIRRGLRWSAR